MDKTKARHTIRIKVICCLIGMFSLQVSFAQYQEKHEISAFIGGGYSSLKYSVDNGKHKLGFGGTAGIGYNFFFSDYVSLGTGAEISRYSARAEAGNFAGSYPTNDGEEDFTFIYTINNYKENQYLWTVNVPLMLQLQYPLFFDDHFCYLALGGRVGFPVGSKYKTTEIAYTASAYYPQYDLLLTDPPSQGLGTFYGQSYSDDIDFKMLFALSAEMGFKWMIADQFSLYTGLYCDYGLNDISPEAQNMDLLIYNKEQPSKLNNNSILCSLYSNDEVVKKVTGKIKPLAFGIKIRLAFRVPDALCF